MSKLKTNRSISKRFRFTGSGKLKRAQAFKNHILTKKRSKRKNKLAKVEYVRSVLVKKLRHVISK